MRGPERIGIETVVKNNGKRIIKYLRYRDGDSCLAYRIERAYERRRIFIYLFYLFYSFFTCKNTKFELM